MGYQGWNLKLGDYIVPQDRFIKADSYSAYVNMQVLDPYTDADGYLHMNAVELKALKVEFETPPLNNDDFEEFMGHIRENFINENSRGILITIYVAEYGDYVTQYGYMADIKPSQYGTYGGKIHFNPCRFSFIGGVYPE